jgi:lysophospholipase L1-like esterase
MSNRNIFIIIGSAFVAAIGTIIGVSIYRNSKKINSKKPFNLLFIGDSYTDNPNSYADQLKAMLPNANITKIAKVGQKTDWMLSNASKEIQSEKYDAVFILGGINDIYARNSIAVAENSLQTMYNQVKQTPAKLIGISIASTDYYPPYDATKGRLTDELNTWIRNNRSLDYFIDMNSLLKKNGKQNLDLFNPDKLHPTPYAQKLLASEIKQKMFA